MKMKHRVKGFTLIELIIVMALFSLIMFSILQLLRPVSKFFVRSSNFENTTACVDNMKRAIEGNLKYANRVRCYVDYLPYNAPHSSTNPGDYAPTATLQRHVQNFYDEFFGRSKSAEAMTQLGAAGDTALRQYVDCRGTIYVLVFDNRTPGEYNAGSLTSFNELGENAGKIVMYEFPFDNTGATPVEFNASSASYTVHPWYVNQKMYGNFDYQFRLNAGDNLFDNDHLSEGSGESSEEPSETPAVPPEFDPGNFAITLNMYEVRKAGTETPAPDFADINGVLVRNMTPKHESVTFSMKNVLAMGEGVDNNYSTPLMEYKVYRDVAHLGYDVTRTEGQEYFQDNAYPIPKYYNAFINGQDYSTARYPEPYTGYPMGSGYVSAGGSDAPFTGNIGGVDAQGFYFIYTLPSTTYGYINPNNPSDNYPDGGYLSQADAAFTTAPST